MSQVLAKALLAALFLFCLVGNAFSATASRAAGASAARLVLAKADGVRHRASLRQPRKSIRKVGKSKRSRAVQRRARFVRRAIPRLKARVSYASKAGLHRVDDPLDLAASVAYVIDQDTRRVLVGKNDSVVLPIASLTKLMTGLIVAEARLPLDEEITIAREDVDTLKGSSSRLRVGTTLSRREALHLALMSSENRAAHALARTYPGGVPAFVSAMNNKAAQLGMLQTRYVDPTGLSPRNQATARDLALLASAAGAHAILRKFSTSPGYRLPPEDGGLRYGNTNPLVRSDNWRIGLQKTGYISEAGQCLLLQTRLAGRKLIMVFLDSAGKLGRVRDAERVRKWLRSRPELARVRGHSR